VARDGPAAGKKPATEIVRTQRNSVVCTYNCACVCLCVFVPGNLYLYHHTCNINNLAVKAIRK
jgi:hypothetical protein